MRSFVLTKALSTQIQQQVVEANPAIHKESNYWKLGETTKQILGTNFTAVKNLPSNEYELGAITHSVLHNSTTQAGNNEQEVNLSI